jgi:hypothetical protein
MRRKAHRKTRHRCPSCQFRRLPDKLKYSGASGFPEKLHKAAAPGFGANKAIFKFPPVLLKSSCVLILSPIIWRWPPDLKVGGGKTGSGAKFCKF